MERHAKSGLRFSFRKKGSRKPSEGNVNATNEPEEKKEPIKMISQQEAQSIDEELFNEYKFSIDQLMELAGLSCAQIIAKVYPLENQPRGPGNVLVVCGPGNNGGDGLVCARHLKHYGYRPTIFYPKRPDKDLFQRLTVQCEKMGIPFLYDLPKDVNLLQGNHNFVVDALFGFSFSGPVRPQFMDVLTRMKEMKIPVVSIDVPSGWHVDNGDPEGLNPDCLISLTAPKLCARYFKGKYHFLGGRFIPLTLEEKYELSLPKFAGSDTFVQLPILQESPNSPTNPTNEEKGDA